MKYIKEDYELFPLKDFAENSPLLQQIGWTNRSMAGLIRTRVGLEGRHDSNRGGWMTSKYAIIQALKMRNHSGLSGKIDLLKGYEQISSEPISVKATG